MDNYVLVSAHNFSWNRKYLIWYTCQWLDKCACLYLCTVKNDTNHIAFGIGMACHDIEHTIRYTNENCKRNISLSLAHLQNWLALDKLTFSLLHSNEMTLKINFEILTNIFDVSIERKRILFVQRWPISIVTQMVNGQRVIENNGMWSGLRLKIYLLYREIRFPIEYKIANLFTILCHTCHKQKQQQNEITTKTTLNDSRLLVLLLLLVFWFTTTGTEINISLPKNGVESIWSCVCVERGTSTTATKKMKLHTKVLVTL